MQRPEALQTNSFSVQLFMGSVAGTEVPDRVVDIVGKFPLRNEQISEKQNQVTYIFNNFYTYHSHPFSRIKFYLKQARVAMLNVLNNSHWEVN